MPKSMKPTIHAQLKSLGDNKLAKIGARIIEIMDKRESDRLQDASQQRFKEDDLKRLIENELKSSIDEAEDEWELERLFGHKVRNRSKDDLKQLLEQDLILWDIDYRKLVKKKLELTQAVKQDKKNTEPLKESIRQLKELEEPLKKSIRQLDYEKLELLSKIPLIKSMEKNSKLLMSQHRKVCKEKNLEQFSAAIKKFKEEWQSADNADNADNKLKLSVLIGVDGINPLHFDVSTVLWTVYIDVATIIRTVRLV